MPRVKPGKTTRAWHKKWRTTARAQIALIRGDTDASYLDRFIEFDPNSATFIPFRSKIERDSDDRVFSHLELEARVSYNVWRTLDVSLGWWILRWEEAGEVDRFLDDFQAGPAFRREDVAFAGLTLGVSYWF